MGEFRMPSLGADMVAGTLTEWYKGPGEAVHRGDLIAAVDTDKGSIDVEVFEDGVIDRLVVEPGRKVPVGTLLAVIRGAGEPPGVAPPVTSVAGPAAPPVAPGGPAAPRAAAAVATAAGERVRISPLARRLAAELGVDLARIRGSGAGGVIVKGDIEAAARSTGAAAPAPAPATPPIPTPTPPDEGPVRMRRAIAAAMVRSKREIPHFYLAATLDFGPASAWLTGFNAHLGPAARILPAALLLKATAMALLEFPELNARWENDRVAPADAIHIGVATSLRGGGLVVPAIHHPNRKTLEQIMQELRDIVQRARTATLRSSDLADGTVTVTSLGDRGADAVFGVIYPPQTALIGFGSVVTRPWVVEGQVVARAVVTASLAADHRACDGHRGGVFLTTIGRFLERPEEL
jgi:pyruvate dehydrogenase E2 component (dihydrolipoamide acetyltransferase)